MRGGKQRVLVRALGRVKRLSVLDFGCGVGRVIRYWAGVCGPVCHGTDDNPDLIAWCRSNVDFARFQVNGLDPPRLGQRLPVVARRVQR